ncbi:FecR domain-containing protein [Pendulispora albinea]|uniref:FecR family protein n=1 Tax=Pendulispora albinea TaxID=2741071 RepID=A0ABZ2M0C9_9BACT
MKVADLKTPLREHLEDGFDEADLHRTWRGVQRQLARREVGANRHALWAIAFGSVMAALAFVLWLAHGPWFSAGPLRLARGPLPSELGGPGAAAPMEFSDGSRVTLAPNSHLEVLQNSGDAFVTALRRGRSNFEVHPGGPRRWVIECGLATVEVVGTAFSIQRDAGRVGVSVERGVVVVRGEQVPGHEKRLVAGDQLEIVGAEAALAGPESSAAESFRSFPQPLHFSQDDRSTPSADGVADVPGAPLLKSPYAAPVAMAPAPVATAPAASAPAASESLAATAPVATEPAASESFVATAPPEAYAPFAVAPGSSAPATVLPPLSSSQPAGPLAPAAPPPAAGPLASAAPASAAGPLASAAPMPDPVDIMLREADRAQRTGDRRRAADVLHRVIQDAHGDPRASFAAFTLARLTMEDDPRASAALLSAMIEAGAPRGLEEDARARLVEAYARAGERARAQSAAADYERRFPRGSRLTEVRRWAHP